MTPWSDRRAYGVLSSRGARKFRCFRNEDEARVALKFYQAIAGDKRAQDWCRRNGLGVAKASSQVTNLNASGGFIVPDEVSDAVITLKNLVGVARQTCQTIDMTSDVTTVPRFASGATASWTAEATAPADSAMQWNDIGLTAKKLMTNVRTSSELTEDALGLADQLSSEIAYRLADGEDAAWINGDSTSTYAGITGVINSIANAGSAISAASGHSSLVSLDSTDLGSVYGSLPSYAYANAAWFCHPVVFGYVFARLAGDNGGIGRRLVNGVTLPTFWNLPIYLSAKMPSGLTSLSGLTTLLVGDMSQAVALGSRREVTIAVSAGRLFDSDQLYWRGTERLDIVVHDVGTASAAGPVCALLGHS